MSYKNSLFLIIFVCEVVLSAGSSCQKTLVVDQSGNGDFKSIQSAINSVPFRNRNWICIQVNAGIYREKVKVPYGKSYIMLNGAGSRQTRVEMRKSAAEGALRDVATLEIGADNFVAKNIAFVNGYNYPWNGRVARVPAPAAYLRGDKIAFYNCGFYGVQDTLFDALGRHYFSKCLIVGAVDFIFGAGQSVYEDTTINVLGQVLKPSVYGYITANRRDGPNNPSWFIFIRCKIVGQGMAYLGRPWRPYARVLFYQTYMSDVVHPKGWSHWIGHGTEHSVFSEYQCQGPGADKSKRAHWRVELTGSSVKKLATRNYIDYDAWIEKIPKY